MRIIGRNPLFFVSLAFVPTFLLISTMVACSGHRPAFTVIPEPVYARPILEKSLISFNNSNYDTYHALERPDTLRANKGSFTLQVTSVKSLFGDYIAGSAQFSDASFQYSNVLRYGYTVADYQTKFTGNPAGTVLVEIAFIEINGKIYVESIGFGSRKTFGDE